MIHVAVARGPTGQWSVAVSPVDCPMNVRAVSSSAVRAGQFGPVGLPLIATNSPSPPHKVCMRAVAYPEQQDIGTKPQQQLARDNSTKNPWLYGYLVHTLRLVHNQVFYSRCLNCSTFLLRFLSCFCTLILAILRKLTNTASVTVRNCIV